ncbi:DUF2079 domain-containing protein [Limnospira indica]|uniref:DUF2079 domain-containing protein n=1 Tax=Limnospira indica TaxID=147322 RepID=UPI0018614911|nr:DUF2079 domain-containing protein [Limnospira indica]QNH57579.1 MAG: DUF2079 domain-containing protein [Limnospira indica BM01]
MVLLLHRYFTFYASYDQGIFNQVFWNGIHGRFFQSSLSSALSTNVVHQGQFPNVSYHRLGQHFTPALLLWLPLYAIFPSPVTLSVLQVTLVTAAGLVLYLLARQYLEPPLSALIVVSFYGANAVIGPTLANFHDVSQIPLFVFTLLLAMEKGWWWLFWILSVLILGVREDAGVVLFGVGVYMILSHRFPRRGLIVCVLSFGYMLVLTNLIMPLFSADISQRFMMERFGQYAEGDEASTLQIIWGMVSNPLRFIQQLFTPFGRTVTYLLGQWLPLAFIPAIAPGSWMIAGFPLLKLFSAQGMSVLAITIRYAMTVVPGLFYGSILWWSKQQEKSPEAELPSPKFRRFWVACICLSLIFTVTSNPNRTLYFLIPDSIQPWVYVSLDEQWPRSQNMRSLLAQIPPDASVAGTTYLIPHLSSRREVLRFPLYQLINDQGQLVAMDYIIADLWQLQRYQVAFSGDRDALRAIVETTDRLTSTQEYGILHFHNGLLLMRRGVTSNPDAIEAWGEFRQEVIISTRGYKETGSKTPSF